jgi:hypothetical protein
MFLVLILIFSFSFFLLFLLERKSNKKFKANPNGSARFAGQRTGSSHY